MQPGSTGACAHAPPWHAFVAQSASVVQSAPGPQGRHASPPQSTSVSSPFTIPSAHVGSGSMGPVLVEPPPPVLAPPVELVAPPALTVDELDAPPEPVVDVVVPVASPGIPSVLNAHAAVVHATIPATANTMRSCIARAYTMLS